MPRTTKAELEQLAAIINNALHDNYTVEWAYGRPRLHRAGGTVEVSPRLSTGELADWMRAFIKGIDAADRRVVTATRLQESRS